MPSLKLPQHSSPFAGRLLVIADRKRLAELLQQQYPSMEVATAPSYLSGIAELTHGPVHGILAFIDPAFGSLDRALRGLRSAAGESVPVILCCEPESEPIAKKALASGASDYLIYPPDFGELDRLLSLKSQHGSVPAPAPVTNDKEMTQLAQALKSMNAAPQRMLQHLAELLIVALPARSATVEADGITVRSGEAGDEPLLRESILRDAHPIGEITIGSPRSGTYSSSDVEKLRYYAEVFGHIVHAAKREHEWQQLAMTDDLTGLPNRRYLLRFLERILQRAARERTRVTVCMFDVDNFKKYNDDFGHAAGDEIIRATGQLFLRHCRVEDVVARYGGDEFCVVFWDAESPRVAGSEHPAQAISVMRRFQEALKTHEFGVLGPGAKGVLTISGGLATYPWDATTPRELLECADKALLQAKEEGKNCIRLLGSAS